MLARERGLIDAHARIALRNAGLLLVQRGGLVVVGFLFVAVVPRLMGPDMYGRFALVLSLSTLFVAFSTLGFTEVMGRYVPEVSTRPDPSEVRRLFGNLLTLRLGSSAIVGIGYLAITLLWLRELDPVALMAAAGAVLARAVSQYVFSFFLGLNQAARWGAGEVIGRVLLLVLVAPGVVAAGFRGACFALFLAELIVLAIGLWWNRSDLALSWLRLDRSYVTPYVRFGLYFFGGTLLSVAFQASGEALVRVVSGDYAQVSYFGLANGIWLTAGAAIHQLSLAFTAQLVRLRGRGQREMLGEGMRHLTSWLTGGSMTIVFAVLFLGGDLVPAVMGSSFRPVAANLIPMTLTLLVWSLSSTAGVVLLTHDRPGAALIGGGVRLAGFWSLGPLLTARWESLGACLAVLLASILHAMYVAWQVRQVMPGALRAWGACVGLGALFLPLLLLRASWTVNLALYLLFLAGYFSALLLTRVVTPGEINAAWTAMKRGGAPPAPEAGKQGLG